MDTLQILMTDIDYDVAGITDTWLDESHDCVANMENYTVHLNTSAE